MFTPPSYSDLQPTGIGAFQGDSNSSLVEKFRDHLSLSSDFNSSPHGAFTTDSLEFLEFLSRYSVNIIPPEELMVRSELENITDGKASEGTVLYSRSRTIRPRFRICNMNLRGANMKVLKAYWKGNPVALKVFKTAYTPMLGSRASECPHRFRQYTRLMEDIRYEIQIMNKWSLNHHRNIVHLLGISFEEEASRTVCDNYNPEGIPTGIYLRPILITSFAHESYPDLRYYLKSRNRLRPLPVDACVRLISDIADGVHGLHTAGVIHADLKPENILIFPGNGTAQEGDIVAKITDFGFSGHAFDGLTPRGGTRHWNAPECLRSCVDVELHRYSGSATRDIYSFGLVMLHIILDGEEPLPFHDLEALDELKLKDEAKVEALDRLRSYYSKYRDNSGPYELERFENVIFGTLQLFPEKRLTLLSGVRSYLSGRNDYGGELKIVRAVGNTFPALAAMKYDDPLHEIAEIIPAIQKTSKKIPFFISTSIFQHYLYQNIEEIPWITKMRALGLATQEMRNRSIRSTVETAAEIKVIQEIECQLLKEYAEYRNPERRVRSYIVGFSGSFYELQEGRTASYSPGFLHDIQQGVSLDRYLVGKNFPETLLNLRIKGGFGVLHCAAYYDRYDIIRQLLHSGLPVNDRAGEEKYTALHIAAAKGNVSSIRTLLEEGADVNCVSWGELGCNFTPLSLVFLWCHDSERAVEAFELLANYGENLSRSMYGRVSLAHMAAKRKTSRLLQAVLSREPALLDARDVYHRTPLHVAAEEGRLENVKLLLAFGAKLSLRDYMGKIPLEVAENRRIKDHDKMAPGIESDITYKLLTRNIYAVVSTDELDTVVFYIMKATEQKGLRQEEVVRNSFSKNTAMALSSPHPYRSRLMHPAAKRFYKFRFAAADAVTVPRVQVSLTLPNTLRLKPKYGRMRNKKCLVLEPRYGLRFIYNVMRDIPPSDYQLIMQLGRLQHQWNDFPMMLQVFKLPQREMLFCHLWQTSHCLPTEQAIYTLKFGTFRLFERADIEISLSTTEIGSEASPSAGLALNWVAIEPVIPDVPVYGVLSIAAIGERRKDNPDGLDGDPIGYSQRDEINHTDTSPRVF